MRDIISKSVSYPSRDSRFPNLPSPSLASTTSDLTTSTVPANKVLVTQPISLPKKSQSVFRQKSDPKAVAAASIKRVRSEDQIIGSPAKKRFRWSDAEDAEITRLKDSGMTWEDISKKLRGRSAISCRSHYQNLERRSEKKQEWDEKKRNKPGRVGQRRRTPKFTQVFEGHDLTPLSSNREESCTPRSADSQQHPFPKASNETSNHQHSHGCFRCGISQTFDTCDGWKRHMKEHETVFPCRQCEDSATAARNPRSYTRKANLVNHLIDTHNMSDSEASAQADTCRKTVKKKYFSCGFCVSLFGNIVDQLNHIDTEHFRYRQDISGWNISKVIRGLIQQPGVSRLWQNFFGVGTWNDSVARNLQLRLELSVESAEVLAAATKSQVIWTEIPQHKKLPGFAEFMMGVQDLIRTGK
ncbi:hypothetical protein OEA41_008686 [Lepraria neglecta]|uniref:C2H2-type domain-containing protein n=1 Tax=Lepraria neglecta TaxID=209136 RepID=A0AAE0DJK1_9LECA|nr:hypothetical protein OEA41_008686 [Lepraria neglecta]